MKTRDIKATDSVDLIEENQDTTKKIVQSSASQTSPAPRQRASRASSKATIQTEDAVKKPIEQPEVVPVMVIEQPLERDVVAQERKEGLQHSREDNRLTQQSHNQVNNYERSGYI